MVHWVCSVHSVASVPPGLLCLTGITPWNDPTSSDIKATATDLARHLIPSLTNFALDPHVTFTTYVWQRVHFGIWRVGNRVFVVGVNLNSQVRSITLTQIPECKGYTESEVVYDGGASFELGNLALGELGSVGFILVVQ